MKSAVAEERRIQQQIVAQQKKELAAFLENQKKEYRLCKDKIKEVNIIKEFLTPHPMRQVKKTRFHLQEMSEDPCTPKEEKQERLSRHKETIQRSQAEEEAHLLAQQRLVYDRSCRALKRRGLIKRHEMEQEQLREVTRVLLTHTHVFLIQSVFFFTRQPLTSQKINVTFPPH